MFPFDRKPSPATVYTWLIREFGPDSPLALGWHTRESQQLRFEVFAKHLNFSGKTVLDVGCGMADLYAYLRAHQIDCHYIGIDITPAMVEIAKQHYPELDIRLGDATDAGFSVPADIVVFSGTFNYKMASHVSAVQKVISRLWSLSREALAFNMLSAQAPRDIQDPHLAYVSPARMLTITQALTPFVLLDHHYLIHDFTTVMYRHAHSP